jgi:hypothetical protein
LNKEILKTIGRHMNNTITSGDAHNDSALASPDAPSLEKALEKSEDVKEKMVDCVAELSIVNEAVKQEMAAGILTREGRKALAQSESVEEKVCGRTSRSQSGSRRGNQWPE